MGTANQTMTLGILVALGAASVTAGRTHEQIWLIPEAKARVSDDFDWQTRGPLDFIDHLKLKLRANTIPTYTIWSYHRGWLQKSDLPALEALVDSSEPCAALRSPLSSRISPKGSTVGAVAKELIEGFQSGGFPTWNAEAARRLGK